MLNRKSFVRKINTLAFSLAVAFAALLVGCSSDKSTSQDPEQTLHMAFGAEPQTLDPHMAAGVPDLRLLAAIIEPLTDLDPHTYEAVPALAKSWDISEDGLVYTFHLRENAKWSDGTPLTAQDFVFSWQRILSPAIGGYYVQDYYNIVGAEDFNTGKSEDFTSVGVKAISNHALQFTLLKPDPLFAKRMAHETVGPVQPATILKFGNIDDATSKWTQPPNYVSNGPFVMTRWEINKVIVLEKNPHYWDAENVKLEKIYAYPIEDIATEERMFRSGQIHVAWGGDIPTEKIETYQKESPEKIIITPMYGTYFYIFNNQVAPFDNADVRRAFTYALDREMLTSKIAKGGKQPSTTLSLPVPHFNPESPIEYNPQKAAEYLAKAGYPNGEGFPQIALLYNTDELHKKIAVAAQQMWKKHLNVNVTLENQEWKFFLENRKNKTFTLARGGSISTFADPIDFLQSYMTGHGMNDSDYRNSDFDALVNKALYELDPVKRGAYLEEAEELLLNDAAIAPVLTYTEVFLKAPEVKNAIFSATAKPNYKDIYLDFSTTEKQPQSE